MRNILFVLIFILILSGCSRED
ncbi:lipoprotein, partial [Bullifex porci]